MKNLKLASLVTIVLGVLLWNGWILGWLNHGWAGYSRMSISEMNVLGQPHAVFFSMLELFSGLLLLVGAAGAVIVKHKNTLAAAAILLIGLIGGLTVFDAGHPLDCSQYQNAACAARATAGEVSQTDKQHNAESRITAYVTVLLAITILAWAYLEKLPRQYSIVALVILAGVIITLEILNYSDHVFANAIAERIWNTLVSIDILLFCYKLFTPLKLMRG